MKTKHFTTLLLTTLCFIACDDHNQPTPPAYDTTIVVSYDTTYQPIQRIDTIGYDTLVDQHTDTLDNNRVIVGYVYSGFPKVPDAFLNTHICYAFAKLTMSDDSVYLGFEVQNEERFQKVVDLKKKNPDLKISLSFSNSAQGGGFSRMVSVPAYRKQFAQDCLKFCQERGIDGIDLDWEHPGMAYNASYLFDVYNDVDNYTALFKDVREALGPNYLLTLAAPDESKQPIKTGGYRYADMLAIEPYIDWANLMSYDFASAPNPHNGVFAANAYWDINRTYRSYFVLGFPMEKCVLGIAFYGRHTFDSSDKEWMYYEIEEVLLRNWPTRYTKKFNNLWKVPVLYKDGAMFCSYDDPQSIAYKGDYAINRGMRGLMYWEVEGDNNKKDLQHACYKAMKTAVISDTSFTPIMDTIQIQDTIIIERRDTTITKKSLSYRH
ncbi:MAG: glycosyl hydrolase family 18 protein [Paludibacteraceae bacterium]|nr:glycosyl hydrolase family 18 protein [Paludibacteraceae bacterium]